MFTPFTRAAALVAALCALLIATTTAVGHALPTEEIAFDSDRAGDPDLYLLDIHRNLLVRLTRRIGEQISPAWSPDGQYLAYIERGAANADTLRLMRADGSDDHAITTVHLLAASPALAWSPDGLHIAYSTVDGGTQGIYVYELTSGRARRLNRNIGNAFAPSWSRDNQIAFTWSPVANSEIYVLAADQIEDDPLLAPYPLRLTDSPFLDTAPAWSPDGQRIAFSSDRTGNSEIYLMNADGSRLAPVTRHSALDTMPSWSSDGMQIVFVSNRDGNRELYIMNADGMRVRRVTFHPAQDSRPAWRPRAL